MIHPIFGWNNRVIYMVSLFPIFYASTGARGAVDGGPLYTQ